MGGHRRSWPSATPEEAYVLQAFESPADSLLKDPTSQRKGNTSGGNSFHILILKSNQILTTTNQYYLRLQYLE